MLPSHESGVGSSPTLIIILFASFWSFLLLFALRNIFAGMVFLLTYFGQPQISLCTTTCHVTNSPFAWICHTKGNPCGLGGNQRDSRVVICSWLQRGGDGATPQLGKSLSQLNGLMFCFVLEFQSFNQACSSISSWKRPHGGSSPG